MGNLPYLNLGCGGHFHSGWVNVDFSKTGEDVIAHNLLNGVPFSNHSFEVVYHSHVLEHFPKQSAKHFIDECYRVLKPGGIIRIVVPDLETIAKHYIRLLEAGKTDPANDKLRADYNWIMIEMYDQTVRNNSGGEMLKYLSQEELVNEHFVMERIGYEGRALRDSFLNGSDKLKRNVLRLWLSRFKQMLLFKNFRESVLKRFLNREYQLLQTARFRAGGEIHQWMYDFYSLSKLLQDAGFHNIEQKNFSDSNIPNWRAFKLDEVDERVRKPDSLFVEALK